MPESTEGVEEGQATAMGNGEKDKINNMNIPQKE